MPNSPLTPLTPLCENSAFDFNFGGDGSLDVYIDNIRHKHRVEQQQKTAIPTHKEYQVVPKRYSERFLKIRDVFEPQSKQHNQFEVPQCRLHLKDPPKKLCCHATSKDTQAMAPPQQVVHHKDCQILRHQQQQQQQKSLVTPQAAVKIIHTGATPPKLHTNYVATPKNVRTPLKQRNYNVALNQPQKLNHHQQMQKQKQQQYRAFLQALLPPSPNRVTARNQHFIQASPVALKPLCPRVSKILQHCGLTMYCGLFQKEEIDIFIFKLLQRHDLKQMGVTDAKHCDMLLTEICYARQYF